MASIDGLDNFSSEHSPTVGVILSRKVEDRATFYLEPLWIGNADVTDRFGFSQSDGSDDDYTFLVGIGTRVRLRANTYVLAEFIPGVSGFDPDDHHMTFGIERRVGGHLFQLNFSNSLGTTAGQVARGGDNDSWYIGFNITRRFF